MKPGTGKTLIAAAALLAAMPATAEEAAPPAPTCADRPKLQAEHDAVRKAIADYAMHTSDSKERQRSLSAGRTAAQAALGLLMPFGVGLAVGGTVALAEAADKSAKAKKPKPPPPPEPDIGAMIVRQQDLEATLAALDKSGCPAAPAPAKAAR